MSFITLEGGEGAGKGSVLASLADLLREMGLDVVVTREPGGTREGAAIRTLVVESGSGEWDPLCELLLLMADRAQHVARIIRPALEAGRTVVCDRFEGSTYAYQGAGKGLSPALIASLQSIVAEGLAPNLTIFLDVDPATGLARSTRRLQTIASREDRFETLDLAFHERVRACFLDQARANPQRWIVIDANRPLDGVLTDVREQVAKRFK
jgi:dTMP kinase